MARFRYRNHHTRGRFPVHEAPVHEVPVHQDPLHQDPADNAPVHEVPVHEVPVHEVPVHLVPVDHAEHTHAATPPAPGSARAHAPARRTGPRRRTPRTGLGVVTPQTTDTWRELLAPDGAPLALPFQVDYVRAVVWQQTGLRPSLRGLTIGQATRILRALNVDPRPLWHSGRNNWAMNVLAICGKWLAFAAVFMLILGVGRTDGVPFVLLILAGLGMSAARRQRRQAFEERYYRRADGDPRASRAVERAARRTAKTAARNAAKRPALPPSPSAPLAPPAGGDPYDVETYLRRLDDESR